MVDRVESRVLDFGLDVLNSEADELHICSADPATYSEATTTYSLGSKNLGAGTMFGAPADATPNGRKVSSGAITDGSVTSTDDATHWAVVDTANTRLLAVGSLAATVSVTSGNSFSLGSFDITLPAEEAVA